MFKILISGKNKSLIDLFFNSTYENYEYMSCTDRMIDITTHLEYFKPSAYVYCAKNVTKELVVILGVIKNTLIKYGVPFVLVSSSEDFQIIKSVNQTLVNYFVEASSIEYITNSINTYLAHVGDGGSAEMIQNQSVKESNPAASVTSDKKSILVIDDDPVMLKTIKTALSDNYNVATSLNGQLALKFLEKKTADLILLDYMMPGLDGPEVFAALKDNPATAKIPVIFLTGIADSTIIKEVLSFKPQGYLLKPVDYAQLKSKILDVIG